MYFIPVGILLRDNEAVLQAAGVEKGALDHLTWGGFLWYNLLPVTIGNVIGGALMVAAVYWLVYLRPRTATADALREPKAVSAIRESEAGSGASGG
jgi:hypothetical protein